jgi:hypothetical protein
MADYDDHVDYRALFVRHHAHRRRCEALVAEMFANADERLIHNLWLATDFGYEHEAQYSCQNALGPQSGCYNFWMIFRTRVDAQLAHRRVFGHPSKQVRGQRGSRSTLLFQLCSCEDGVRMLETLFPFSMYE